MKSTSKLMIAGIALFGLGGAAFAQSTPATRQCQNGEQLIGGACQPLTRAPAPTDLRSNNTSASPGATTGSTTGGAGQSGSNSAAGGAGSAGESGAGQAASGGTGNGSNGGGASGGAGGSGSGGGATR